MSDNNLVDINIINEMLYGDPAYVKEFADASIESFSEFNEQFKTYLLARDIDSLKRAGHKIKPVAQMLCLNPVIDIYEESKKLLKANAASEELAAIADKMNQYCSRVITEFRNMEV